MTPLNPCQGQLIRPPRAVMSLRAFPVGKMRRLEDLSQGASRGRPSWQDTVTWGRSEHIRCQVNDGAEVSGCLELTTSNGRLQRGSSCNGSFEAHTPPRPAPSVQRPPFSHRRPAATRRVTPGRRVTVSPSGLYPGDGARSSEVRLCLPEHRPRSEGPAAGLGRRRAWGPPLTRDQGLRTSARPAGAHLHATEELPEPRPSGGFRGLSHRHSRRNHWPPGADSASSPSPGNGGALTVPTVCAWWVADTSPHGQGRSTRLLSNRCSCDDGPALRVTLMALHRFRELGTSDQTLQ